MRPPQISPLFPSPPLSRSKGIGLILGVPPPPENPPVRCQLIRHTADETRLLVDGAGLFMRDVDTRDHRGLGLGELVDAEGAVHVPVRGAKLRSEERRVGKECRSRWSPYH